MGSGQELPWSVNQTPDSSGLTPPSLPRPYTVHFQAFPISPLGEQDSPRALPAIPVCVGYSPAVLRGGLRQGKRGESRKSVCSYSSDRKCV